MATFDQTVTITYTNPAPDPSKGDVMLTERISGQGPAVRSAFVQLLKLRAWVELDKQAPYMTPARYTRLEAALMRDMGAGKYEWGDDVHNGIDETRTGFELMLAARIRAGNPTFNATHVEAIVNEIGWERLQALCQQADGPAPKKAPAPTTDSAAGPAASANG